VHLDAGAQGLLVGFAGIEPDRALDAGMASALPALESREIMGAERHQRIVDLLTPFTR
jgi:hypothetical protein